MLTFIKIQRLSKNIKAKNLALEAGISPSLLSRIERGLCNGTKKTREKLSKALNIPEKILFGRK